MLGLLASALIVTVFTIFMLIRREDLRNRLIFLAGEGRLLVRYSGTEPLLRVMIEGRNQQEIQGWASEIAAAVKEHLG